MIIITIFTKVSPDRSRPYYNSAMPNTEVISVTLCMEREAKLIVNVRFFFVFLLNIFMHGLADLKQLPEIIFSKDVIILYEIKYYEVKQFPQRVVVTMSKLFTDLIQFNLAIIMAAIKFIKKQQKVQFKFTYLHFIVVLLSVTL